MAFSFTHNRELKELHELCDWDTNEGTTPDGRKVRSSYKLNGNWAIYVDGKYVGTAYYS